MDEGIVLLGIGEELNAGVGDLLKKFLLVDLVVEQLHVRIVEDSDYLDQFQPVLDQLVAFFHRLLLQLNALHHLLKALPEVRQLLHAGVDTALFAYQTHQDLLMRVVVLLHFAYLVHLRLH